MEEKSFKLLGIVMAVAVVVIAAFLIVWGVRGCASKPAEDTNTDQQQEQQSAEPAQTQEAAYLDAVPEDNPYTGTWFADVTVDGYGTFTIALDADAAPVTVYNFCSLAADGFYDGLTFHRIVEDFCLQGGDPQGTGTGGSDTNILGEFSENSVDNALADNYKRGVVAMARSNDPNSASSQFFVTLSDDAASSLNGKYAAFGTVDEAGMAVVDAIVAAYKDKADASSGTIADVSAQPKITSITVHQ